jgi:hypothetical protein
MVIKAPDVELPKRFTEVSIDYYKEQNYIYTEKVVNSTNIVKNTTTDGTFFHKNYLEYLELAWSKHYGIVVDPKIFWHMILSEVGVEVREYPEHYRDLFTTSSEKIEVKVSTDSCEILPVKAVLQELKSKVTANIGMFFPEISTRDEMYDFVLSATFCDVVSPYYNYGMYLCGISSFTVLGTKEDF